MFGICPQCIDDAVCVTRECPSEEVPESISVLVVLLTFDKERHGRHIRVGPQVRLICRYAAAGFCFEYHPVRNKQVPGGALKEVLGNPGYRSETDEHGGMDCHLGECRLGPMLGVEATDHIAGYRYSFAVAAGFIDVGPVVLCQALLSITDILGLIHESCIHSFVLEVLFDAG